MNDNLASEIYSIDQVKKAITAWENYVNLAKTDNAIAEGIIRYLNQGFCFNIHREDYNNWAPNNPKYIHAYPAIFESDTDRPLKFVLIDSTSDLNAQENMDYISVKEFHYGEFSADFFELRPPNRFVTIPLLEALHRNFVWKMYCKNWLSGILIDQNLTVFKAICIPFQDFMELFPRDIPDSSAIAFFGLTNTLADPQPSNWYTIELILTNEHRNYSLPSTFYDISRPVPPFETEPGLNIDDFHLLKEI
jgi:hypothetical protein